MKINLDSKKIEIFLQIYVWALQIDLLKFHLVVKINNFDL